MKFVDEATIYVKAGDGGHGCTSFRREKYVPRGGPDGGDGGTAGDVIIVGNKDLTSLLDFKYRHTYKAENGKNGSSSNKKGRDGRDMMISVPLGTQVYDEKEPLLLADVTRDGESFVVAKGGRGGRGNAHFTTPTHRAPVECEPGEGGEERHLKLVIKLLADIGIIGLPNAGKSTLISGLTEAKPKIGDYPFTTLTPTLGVFQDTGGTFVIADIPGIVEGASQGKGLGLSFLKHIERTNMLLWVLDVTSPTAQKDYGALKRELSSYNEALLEKRKILVINKIDAVSLARTGKLERFLKQKGETVARISAFKGWGLHELKELIREKGVKRDAGA
jgi:GTPase